MPDKKVLQFEAYLTEPPKTSVQLQGDGAALKLQASKYNMAGGDNIEPLFRLDREGQGKLLKVIIEFDE